jgi:N-acetylglucosamine kinase-like BadF-type ATPase
MTDSSVWIGIDGGGTKTKAFIINSEGTLLAESINGSSNQNSVGFKGATDTLKALCEELVSSTKRSPADVRGICAGLSGCDRENDKQQFTAFFKSLYSEAFVLMYNDGVLALSSGTLGVLHGIVIISGTGSIAVGFHEKKGKQQFRASGWGPLLGEEGGGYMMGNDCLIAVARAADGRGPATALSALVMKKLDLAKPEDLIAWRYADMSFARPASVTPLLFEAASQDDKVAFDILKKSVNGLCESIESVHRQTEFAPSEEVTIVAAGGNLTHDDSILFKLFSEEIKRRIPAAKVILPSIDPAMAAASIAF